MLSLYEACARRKALPEAGGMLDQPAELMRWFKAIDQIIDRHKQEAQERETWQRSRQT